MTLNPTPEQANILARLEADPANLLITARAGTGKTSTLVMVAKALPRDAFHLALAFNKRMADELTQRLPSNVKASTLNALGHQALALGLSRHLVVDFKKTSNLVKELHPELSFEAKLRLERVVNAAKSLGLCPLADQNEVAQNEVAGVPEQPSALPSALVFTADGWPRNHAELLHITDPSDWADVMTLAQEDDLDTPTELAPGVAFTPTQVMTNRVLLASLEALSRGKIDFADQLWVPTIFGFAFPRTHTLMVDEAQDLSLLNHAMLALIPHRRLIAVGDPMQAIYAFRGAAEDSMSLLQARFSMAEARLTLSFRCPSVIVANARRWVPDFQAASQGGLIQTLDELELGDLPSASTVLCRNNAPLIKVATAALRGGRRVTVLGRDLEKTLKKTLKEILAAKRGSITARAKTWLTAKLEPKPGVKLTSGRRAFLQDQHDTVIALATSASTEDGTELEAYISRLFSDETAPLVFSTGHKAKGMEWPTVIHLQPELVLEEPNIAYVIETRSSNTLLRVGRIV